MIFFKRNGNAERKQRERRKSCLRRRILDVEFTPTARKKFFSVFLKQTTENLKKMPSRIENVIFLRKIMFFVEKSNVGACNLARPV